VILNLAINAIDAMAPIVDRPRELVIRSGRPGRDHVTIAVQDSGVGIEPDDLDRLFNPFFSTKPGGMGMGIIDQPFDRRGAWRPVVGDPQRVARRVLPHLSTGRRSPVPGDRSDAQDREQDPDQARTE
jgi:Histidine kinase-, DNA gyrase B-, and HSP90-like ATPase